MRAQLAQLAAPTRRLDTSRCSHAVATRAHVELAGPCIAQRVTLRTGSAEQLCQEADEAVRVDEAAIVSEFSAYSLDPPRPVLSALLLRAVARAVAVTAVSLP